MSTGISCQIFVCFSAAAHSLTTTSASNGFDQTRCKLFFLTYNHNYKLHLHDVDLYLIVSQPRSQLVPLMTKPSDESGLMR